MINSFLNSVWINSYNVIGYNVDHKKHGSFTIIFTVWNNLLGASLITIPWAFSNAGLIVGTLIVFLSFLISYYTTWLIIKLTRDDEEDFTDTL
jgi:amino acid permease